MAAPTSEGCWADSVKTSIKGAWFEEVILDVSTQRRDLQSRIQIGSEQGGGSGAAGHPQVGNGMLLATIEH